MNCGRAGIPAISLVLNDYYAAKHAGLETAFPARRIIRAEALDAERDGGFLLEHWTQQVRCDRHARRMRERKQKLFERIYLEAAWRR